MSQLIFLDNHATTACTPEVVNAMLPYFGTWYGNASSNHLFGNESRNAVELARLQVAKLINATSKEIIFTSGATESNNLAIQGIAKWHKANGGKRNKIAVSCIEHKSVLSVCNSLAKEGWEITYLPVDNTGRLRLTDAMQLIDSSTILVSVQAANSEIGTIQPINEICQIAHSVGAYMHCDASQAVSKINIDIEALEVDLLSISAHKMHGPKGVGALYIRDRAVDISPIVFGGAQERGLRSGTLPVPLIVGLGEACNLDKEFIDYQSNTLNKLRNRLESSLQASIPLLRVNGHPLHRLPNNSNITFLGVDAELILSNLSHIVISTGSACQSGSIEPSQVLLNIGIDYEECFSTLRFGISRLNTEFEIDQVCSDIINLYKQIS